MALAALYGIRRLFIRRGKRIFRFIASVGRSAAHGIIANADVQKIIRRHPRFFRFLADRLTVEHFIGLPLTLLGITFLYALSLFFGITEGVITSDPIVSVDIRLANLLFAFRSPAVLRLFLWITLLGKWPLVFTAAVGVTSMLWLYGKRTYLVPLWITLLGTELFATLGKLAVHRSRPAGVIPAYHESSFSFPSNHAAAAVAFYGFLAYALTRGRGRWKMKINIVLASLLVIFLVGFSRLYLGVHFLSDVWSGSLMGFLWLIVGISISELLLLRESRRKKPSVPHHPHANAITSALLLFLAIIYCYLGAYQQPPLTTFQATATPIIVPQAEILNAFSDSTLPKFTETISATPQEPVSFIIMATDDNTLTAAMAKAGWVQADELTASSIVALFQAALLNKEYASAPITPSFWNGQIHTFGFERPTAMASVRARHHARFWKTNLTTDTNEHVYVGTASLDSSIKWAVTHRIEPDVDTERETLLHDLLQAEVVGQYRKTPFVRPTLGKNFSGDQFFTDGQVYIVELK